MQQFKKGDRVVYTGERYKRAGRTPINVGALGTVTNPAHNSVYVIVAWDKHHTMKPATNCYKENVALKEPENSINEALAILRAYGAVEFTPHPEPWEGTLWICTKRHNGWGENAIRNTCPPADNSSNWRKINAREVVQNEKE